MDYKIYKRHYHDDYGKIKNESYFIKKKKSFLGITYWKEISHTECSMCDCYKTTTLFKSLKEAEAFVKDILCKGIPTESWVETPIHYMSCQEYKL